MRTINLLPKAKQKQIKYEGIAGSLSSLVWLSVFSFALVFVVQVGVNVYLAAETSSVQKRIQELTLQVNRNENGKLKEQIKGINNTILDFQNLSSAAPKWSRVLSAFAKLPPPNVTVKSLTMDAGKKSITISGFAPSREDVIILHDKIAADKDNFFNIDYPLENVAKPKNVNFHFSFSIKDSLLK